MSSAFQSLIGQFFMYLQASRKVFFEMLYCLLNYDCFSSLSSVSCIRGWKVLCPISAPGDFLFVLCRPPAIILCLETTFARNSVSLVSPPAVFQNCRGPNSGTRHLKNRRGRTRHLKTRQGTITSQSWFQDKKFGYLDFIKINEIWTTYVTAFCTRSDVFEFLKKTS